MSGMLQANLPKRILSTPSVLRWPNCYKWVRVKKQNRQKTKLKGSRARCIQMVDLVTTGTVICNTYAWQTHSWGEGGVWVFPCENCAPPQKGSDFGEAPTSEFLAWGASCSLLTNDCNLNAFTRLIKYYDHVTILPPGPFLLCCLFYDMGLWPFAVHFSTLFLEWERGRAAALVWPIQQRNNDRAQTQHNKAQVPLICFFLNNHK